ncbi:complement resistance protein TraT [Rheinheimera sp. WS51]|uniref:complement resistance protein TraT n=1 Tax=Rheinheimera sp. WS51 TaxID=3425886 RepID=UPI003D93EB34
MKKRVIFAGVIAATLVLSGCGATHTMISKRTLDVQTRMSETVFLDPVSPDKKTVFIQVRNTSDKPGLSIEPLIISAIQQRGYQVMNDPDKAHYMIQANVLQIGKTDLREAESLLSRGFGGGVAGAVVGAQFGGGSGRGAAGIVGAGLGVVADAFVKDVYFSMITDLQISERAAKGVVVTEAVDSKLKQGTSGYKNVTSSETTNWKRYQTRILSTANKANLEYEEAEPVLVQGLIQSTSGIL